MGIAYVCHVLCRKVAFDVPLFLIVLFRTSKLLINLMNTFYVISEVAGTLINVYNIKNKMASALKGVTRKIKPYCTTYKIPVSYL